jgi:hypothetical protein
MKPWIDEKNHINRQMLESDKLSPVDGDGGKGL